MNTKALNSLAELICRAQEQDRTPMGIAFAIDSAGRHMSPEAAAELERLRARVAELEALLTQTTEFRVWEPGYGLYVRRAPGGTAFAILEANRTSRGRRAWTTSGWRYSAVLAGEELFCWPSALVAVVEARRVMPGASPDGITVVVAPTQALQERPGEFEAVLRHAYTTPHDLDVPGGAS